MIKFSVMCVCVLYMCIVLYSLCLCDVVFMKLSIWLFTR
jgi:hypothetical protein